MKYEIIGEPMPVVVCDLEANEAMITERGSMAIIAFFAGKSKTFRFAFSKNF